VSGFAFRTNGTDWVDVPRVDYNYFVYDQGMGEGPFDFRVTDVYGGVVEDVGVELGDDVERSSASQLPACGG
jgi:expansin (peptidoglycan-binding protein)